MMKTSEKIMRGFSRYRYYIVIRHGEREDESNKGIIEPDSELSKVGVEESFHTGHRLMKNLLLDGWYSKCNECEGEPSLGRIRFISSVMIRCFQTSDAIRQGMIEYLKENRDNKIIPDGDEGAVEKLIDQLSKEKTHIEPAFVERNVKEDPKLVQHSHYFKDQKSLFKRFESIHPHAQELFDYNGEMEKFTLGRYISSSAQILKLVQKLHSLTINKLLNDDEYDCYVVVAHGQTINKLQTYLGSKSSIYPIVHYNGMMLLKLDTNCEKKFYDHINKFTYSPIIYNERIVDGTGFIFNKAKHKYVYKEDETELMADDKEEKTGLMADDKEEKDEVKTKGTV